MGKKVLVTGSCGFVFGNFIRKAIYDQNQKKPQDRSYTFVSVDRVTSNATNSMYWNKNHIFHPADIRDSHVMDVIFQFEKPDIVIHGAAETITESSLKDPNSFITSNVLGTQVIINCCLKHKVEKLIYISTDKVYGQLSTESDPPWDETAPILPRTPYSATKAAGEMLVQTASRAHGLIYNITRSSNCYGPRQFPEKLIPKAIKSALEDQKISIYGSGQETREWTYVADNCTAIIAVLERGLPNEIYNISAKQEFTNLETINLICNSLGKGHELISFIPDPRSNRAYRYSVNTNKIQSLGWKPSYKFKDGIKDTVQWYADNQWFLK